MTIYPKKRSSYYKTISIPDEQIQDILQKVEHESKILLAKYKKMNIELENMGNSLSKEFIDKYQLLEQENSKLLSDMTWLCKPYVKKRISQAEKDKIRPIVKKIDNEMRATQLLVSSKLEVYEYFFELYKASKQELDMSKYGYDENGEIRFIKELDKVSSPSTLNNKI